MLIITAAVAYIALWIVTARLLVRLVCGRNYGDSDRAFGLFLGIFWPISLPLTIAAYVLRGGLIRRIIP